MRNKLKVGQLELSTRFIEEANRGAKCLTDQEKDLFKDN